MKTIEMKTCISKYVTRVCAHIQQFWLFEFEEWHVQNPFDAQQNENDNIMKLLTHIHTNKNAHTQNDNGIELLK